MLRCQQALFEYGIHTEDSHVRAHVSVVNRCIYVFETRRAIEAIEAHNPEKATASQPGVDGITASGWLVKPEWIADLRVVEPSVAFRGWGRFSYEMKTSEKGRWAVDMVVSAMRSGKFPLWLNAEEDDRENIQIQGTDIVLFCRKKIQVKCDAKAGPPPGTGNLFLQSHERNPLKAH